MCTCEHEQPVDSVYMVIDPDAPNPLENVIDLERGNESSVNPFGNWVEYECTAEIEYGPTLHFFKPRKGYYLFPSFWWNRICKLADYLWLRYLIIRYGRNIEPSVEAIKFSGGRSERTRQS